MRILHIIDSLGLGGAQTVVKGIFEEQRENKNIFLLVLRERDIKIEINHTNIFVYNSTKMYSFAPLNELKRIIEREKIDMLHCHLFRSQFLGYILKRRYFPKIKLIFHEHGKIFRNQFVYNFFLKISRRYVDSYLAISQATKKKLIENSKIPENKIKILYNFVDLDKFNRKNIKWDIQKERKKLGIQENEFVIGFASRLVERKGWKEFMKSSSLVLKGNTKIKFLIVGDGQDKKKLINFIEELKLKENVLYLGYVSDMVWFYSLLDGFVIPSYGEAMGLTEIEAQALGVPVIASDVPALNEIITDKFNGLLFKAKNEKDLSKKINILHKDKKLRTQLTKNSIGDVRKYSLDKYIINLNKIYHKVLSNEK